MQLDKEFNEHIEIEFVEPQSCLSLRSGILNRFMGLHAMYDQRTPHENAQSWIEFSHIAGDLLKDHKNQILACECTSALIGNQLKIFNNAQR